MIEIKSIQPQSLPYISLSSRKSLPEVPGIYFVITKPDVIQYIGRTSNLRKRWQQHHRLSQLDKYQEVRIAWLEIGDCSLLPEIEKALIQWFKPFLNQTNIEGEKIDDLLPGRPGTLGRPGRPGGNPDLKYYQFTTTRDEPLTEKLTFRVSKSMLEALKNVEKYPQFCRDAIAEKLESLREET